MNDGAMTGALIAVVCCGLVAAPSPESPAPGPATGPSAETPSPVVEPSAETPNPVVVVDPSVETPSGIVMESSPTISSPPAIDRVELRNGDQLEGELIEFVPHSHMTLRIRGTERRTLQWAEVEYVQRAGEPRRPVSAGKPTIAELATESDHIQKEETIGLGFMYVAYSLTAPSLSTWIAFATRRTDRLLQLSVGTTVTSAALLAIGAGFFFHARVQRKRLRRVILSAAPTSSGALAGAVVRF